ncbi:hypothetical protein QYE76_063865 [Lolium multiflorum]|uniref:Reverse transcriptase Ty1/copia-type domain-containing protein n=1 Tax=Lolium multiflorum TaxID=4521 RepID=A0AAD8S6H7_LOLMU|nr:hypothetical protein QYE76_063865 [Lolium multiflorum]
MDNSIPNTPESSGSHDDDDDAPFNNNEGQGEDLNHDEGQEDSQESTPIADTRREDPTTRHLRLKSHSLHNVIGDLKMDNSIPNTPESSGSHDDDDDDAPFNNNEGQGEDLNHDEGQEDSQESTPIADTRREDPTTRHLRLKSHSLHDIIFGSTNTKFNDEFAKLMTNRFEISMMGELKYFLGFEIKQMRQGTFINQAKYLQDMLKRFDMKDAKGIGTPMHLKCQLSLDETGKAVDPKLYRSMIGSLLYLCASCLGMCARFQESPKESDIVAVKRIFRYLVDTPLFGLWYPRDTDFSLVGFTDSDWAGDKVDRKSTSGACHFLGRSLVCWSSKKENCVSISTAEAEYVAAASSSAQILCMRQTLRDYGLEYSKVPLLCDNESAIKIAYDLVLHGKMNHIEIRNHFIRDHIARGDIVLSFIGIKEQLADIFTKPLDEKSFIELRHELNIIDPSNFA